MSEELPFISILIPCHNEALFLQQCIDSVINGDYPHHRMEILIIDGLSSDSTPQIAEEIIHANADLSIRLLQNPGKIYPAAVNTGYSKASGEFIVILGAHAVYHDKYLTSCVQTALQYNADNTGGILITEGLNTSSVGKAISNVLSSRFGVGNSVFRTGTDKVTEVDTVFGGCYRRKVFENIGLFNEKLISTSDMDFNVRLKKAGGLIMLNPDIRATYFTRNSFSKFIRNNFRNGYWAIYPLRYLDYLPVSFRHLIPLLFFVAILSGAVLAVFFRFFLWTFIAGAAVYFAAALLFSLTYAKKGLLNVVLMPILFLCLHLSYGAGSLLAAFRVIFFKIKALFN